MIQNATAEKYPCDKSRMVAEHSEKEFIRAAWIQLANEDAPLELFEENFEKVKNTEHQILLDKISATANYTVSVGYDREEPYIDYETYYEDEPYITTERYYDSTIKEYRQREVTKYKKVARQRQVTKYKTVTDWSPLSGTHSCKSSAWVENIPDLYFNEDAFTASIEDMQEGSYADLLPEDAARYHISEEGNSSAMSWHKAEMRYSIIRTLPGDHEKSLDFSADIDERSSTLYIADEYSAEITLNGKTYKKAAFPYGSMEVHGDEVSNPVDLDTSVAKLKAELKDRSDKRKEAIEENIRKKMTGLSVLTVALLALSIISSAFIRLFPVVIGAFVLAVAAFIVNKVTLKNTTEAEEKAADDEIALDKKNTQNEIDNFSAVHKAKQIETLNKKLKELGFEPAKDDEIPTLIAKKVG